MTGRSSTAERLLGRTGRLFVPLLSKLRPPVVGQGVIDRPRIIDSLERQRAAAVLIVSAPAGYGKTTLLAQWGEHETRPLAWLQLDEHDNDAVTLMAYVLLALARVADLDPKVDEWLVNETPPKNDLILPTLANNLSSADPFLFVLDDTQVLTEESSWSFLRFLVKHLPPGSQIALSGRIDPPLSRGRLATVGRLVELRSGELSFRREEVESVLAMSGLQLDERALDALLSRTEGWAVGLQLATLYLLNRGDAGAFTEVAGAVGEIPNYLATEVLACLGPRVRRFLFRTSILERLNTGLCNTVVGHGGSGKILADLERSNIFVTRLDERGHWYRYHPLFADWLRTNLERDSPETVPDLQRRAAAWYEAKSMPDDAFTHWLAAGEVEKAGEIVGRHYRTWIISGRGETVLRWLSAFDETEISAYPPLALAGAWMAAALGQSQDAGPRLEAAERGDPQAASLESAATFGSAVLTLRALLGRGGVSALRKHAEIAYELERSLDGVYDAGAACLLGAGQLLSNGDVRSAQTMLEEAATLGEKGSPLARAVSLALLSLIACRYDHWDDAAKLARAAQRVVEDNDISDVRLIACVYAMLALAETHTSASDSAQTHLDHVGPMLPGLAPFPWLAALVATIMAWSALSLGDTGRAAALEREAARSAGKLPDSGRIADWIEDLRHAIAAKAWEGPPLTPSEFRVLQMLTTVGSLSDIANDLYVSPNTLKSHLRVVYRKLGVRSRAEAIVRARSLGMVEF